MIQHPVKLIQKELCELEWFQPIRAPGSINRISDVGLKKQKFSRQP